MTITLRIYEYTKYSFAFLADHHLQMDFKNYWWVPWLVSQTIYSKIFHNANIHMKCQFQNDLHCSLPALRMIDLSELEKIDQQKMLEPVGRNWQITAFRR